MKFEFKLYDKNQIAKIPVYISEWVNYHVTKHILLNNDSEQIGSLVGIDHQILRGIRSIQVEKYKCKVSNNNSQPCFICKYKNECSDTISSISNEYFLIIKKSICNDTLSPRHALYKYKDHKIIFITNSGLNIIADINKDRNIRVNTCYRFGIDHLNDMQLQLMKLYKDDSFHLHASINRWKKQLDNYSYTKYYQEENWI